MDGNTPTPTPPPGLPPGRASATLPPVSPDALAAWRRRVKLTQTEAAAIFGYTRRQIGNFERGIYPVPAVLAWAIHGYEHANPPIAIFDEAVVWGIGDNAEAAWADARHWLGQRGIDPAGKDDLRVAPTNGRLIAALDRHGGALPFVVRSDGVLDLLGEPEDKVAATCDGCLRPAMCKKEGCVRLPNPAIR